MVTRVDRALKDDLDIPNGLAAENVYVLDPCCGTGAYLAEVLCRIAANLKGQGLCALAGARVFLGQELWRNHQFTVTLAELFDALKRLKLLVMHEAQYA